MSQPAHQGGRSAPRPSRHRRLARLIAGPTTGRPRDAGSASLVVVVMALAMLMAIGLVVDGGAQVQAAQRANTAAAQAARASGQAITEDSVLGGSASGVDAGQAASAGRAYLAAAGVAGSVDVINPQTIRVTTSIVYRPIIMSLGGLGPQTVTGSAEVRIADGVAP